MNSCDQREMVFFDSEFVLISDADVIGDSPARVLASHLLRSAMPRMSTRGMFEAMISARRRLQRAMYLIRQVELDEHGARLASAGESWATLAHDLGWAARSPRVRRYLIQLGSAAGIADAPSAADEVQRALGHEILPVTHAQFYVTSFATNGESRGAPSRRAIHGRYLSTWSGPAPTSATFAYLYTVYLRHLAMTSEPPTSAMVEVILQLIASCGGGSIEARALVATFAEVVSSALQGRKMGTNRDTLSMLIDWLSALDSEGPPCAELLDLLAHLYLQRGLGRKRAHDYSASARDLAQACVRDPQNAQAVEALNSLVETVQEQQRRIISSVYSREQLPDALARATRLGDDVQDALSGLEDEDQAAIRRRIHGHICDVVWRLGLDARDPVHLGQADALLAILADADAAPESGQEYADWAEHTALERYPEMAGLPWERLREALLLGRLGSPFELTARLEPPTARYSIPQPMSSSASPDAPAPRPTRWWRASLLWALSWRDPIFKLAAAAGLVLLVYGAVAGIRMAERQARERAAYTAIVDAIERDDDPAALSAAAHFLDRVVPDPDDPRARHVRNLLEQTLVRHTLQLAQRGQLDEAGAVLARYAALGMESPDKPTRVTDTRATEETLP